MGTVEMKKAVAKCHQVDAPELNLPPFRGTYRFINALMSGADEMEQKQMMFAMTMMKMMMKFAMKKKYDDMEYGDMDHYSQKSRFDMSDMFGDRQSSKYESSSKYDSENFMDMVQDKMFEKDMMEKMMMYKLRRESYDEPSSDYKSYNPFDNKDSYRERMAALLARSKRATKNNVAVTLPESLDIGDRLAEKLQSQKVKMESKIGNMTCVLREIGILNNQNELDFNVQKRAVESHNMQNQWLKKRILNDMETCIDVAKSQPASTTPTSTLTT